MELRKCKRCGEEKGLQEFPVSKTQKFEKCKVCTNTLKREWLAKQREKETPEEKEKRLIKQREATTKRRKNETPQQRLNRLQKMNEAKKRKEANETSEEREKRLAGLREAYKKFKEKQSSDYQVLANKRWLKKEENRNKKIEQNRRYKERQKLKTEKEKELLFSLMRDIQSGII
ncbi:MAG: hypothetical protein ACRC6E_09740 [Fusobacteriaceae bacterium]